MPACASKRDVLELATLRCIQQQDDKKSQANETDRSCAQPKNYF